MKQTVHVKGWLTSSRLALAGVVSALSLLGTIFAINPTWNPFVEEADPKTAVSARISEIFVGRKVISWKLLVHNAGKYPILIKSTEGGILQAFDLGYDPVVLNNAMESSEEASVDMIIPPWSYGELPFKAPIENDLITFAEKPAITAWTVLIYEDGPKHQRFLWNRFNCTRSIKARIVRGCEIGVAKDNAVVVLGPSAS